QRLDLSVGPGGNMTLHRRSHFLVFCVVALVGSVLFPRPGNTHTHLATMRGQVVDQQGATVPDALVTAREIATNLTRTSTTQANGQYLLSSLPAGQYELTVEKTGFRTSKRAQLEIQVGQQVTLDFSLSVTSTNETV